MKRNHLCRAVEIGDLDRTVDSQLLHRVGRAVGNDVGIDAHLGQGTKLPLLELGQEDLPVRFILALLCGAGSLLGPRLAPLPDILRTLALAACHHRLDIHGRLRLLQRFVVLFIVIGHVRVSSRRGRFIRYVIGVDNLKPQLSVRDLPQLLELVLGIPDDGGKKTRQLFTAVIGDLHLVFELPEDVLCSIGDRVETILGKIHLEAAGLVCGDAQHGENREQEDETDAAIDIVFFSILSAVSHINSSLELPAFNEQVVQHQEENRKTEAVDQSDGIDKSF